MDSSRELKIVGVANTVQCENPKWNYVPGTTPPQGGPIDPYDRRESITFNPGRQGFTGGIRLGSGWPPVIDWKCMPMRSDDQNLLKMHECELVLHRLATEAGFLYVQVLTLPCRTTNVWDEAMQPDGKYHLKLRSSDLHITVRFGTAPDHCSVYGNIFLAENELGMLDVMPDGMRKHVFRGDDRVLQFWYWVDGDAPDPTTGTKPDPQDSSS